MTTIGFCKDEEILSSVENWVGSIEDAEEGVHLFHNPALVDEQQIFWVVTVTVSSSNGLLQENYISMFGPRVWVWFNIEVIINCNWTKFVQKPIKDGTCSRT